MLFCTQKFLFFFLIVFTVYWLTPWLRATIVHCAEWFRHAIERAAGRSAVVPRQVRRTQKIATFFAEWATTDRIRVWILLGASYYFYQSWNAELARIIFLTTVVDFLIARGMTDWASPRRRKALLLSSILGNIAILCYFKYANFFLESLRQGLEAAGANASIPVLEIVLPIGISFYTFEAISYTVDVYRGKIQAERRLDHFLLFVLFFPHLVAGPIVRAGDFLPQVHRHKIWSWPRMVVGGRLILLGLFKKMVIADRLALLVDPVYSNPTAYESGVVWMAAIAYAIQIYCDFSGYSDIALGCARMLGYRLQINFAMPFAASNIAEFWRRWHISLSSWIRDYVYFPLGGNRASAGRAAFNLIFAMTLCGLWHGAAWNFVVFGVLNGIYLVGHRAFRIATKNMTALRGVLESSLGRLACIALTFFIFALSLVVFRSSSQPDGTSSFEQAGKVFRQMFVPAMGARSPIPPVVFWTLLATVVIGHLVALRPNFLADWNRLPAPVRGFALASFLFVTLILPPETSPQFIYFQF